MAYTKFQPDYYSVLGVRSTASFEEIRAAYRAQVRFFHPDAGNVSPEVSNMKTRELNEAYEVLSSAEKRQEYDEDLHFFQLHQEQDRAQQQAKAASSKKAKNTAPKEETYEEDDEEESSGITVHGLIWVAVIGILLGAFLIMLSSSNFSFSSLFSTVKSVVKDDKAVLSKVEEVITANLSEGQEYLGEETFTDASGNTYYLFKIGVVGLRELYAEANYGTPGPKYKGLQVMESTLSSELTNIPEIAAKHPIAIALYDSASFSEDTLEFYLFFTASDGSRYSGLNPAA